MIEMLKNGSGIHIKKKNRGKFTSYCGGKVTDECIRRAKSSGNPTLVKRATFAANARKWKHQNGGLIIEKALNGTLLKRNVVIPFLYAIENPLKKGVNGDWTENYDSRTIGPGVDSSSGVPSWWFEHKRVPTKDVEQAAYDHFTHDDEVIRKAYDTRFGTENYPHPSDTLSIGPRLYAAQNRYLMGTLGKGNVGRDAILDAMKSGNANKIRLAVKKYGRAGDNDRARRLLKAYPKMYKKGGKAFVPGYDIADSNPKAYKYVKKHYKMKGEFGGNMPDLSAYTLESYMMPSFIVYGENANDYLLKEKDRKNAELYMKLREMLANAYRSNDIMNMLSNLKDYFNLGNSVVELTKSDTKISNNGSPMFPISMGIYPDGRLGLDYKWSFENGKYKLNNLANSRFDHLLTT